MLHCAFMSPLASARCIHVCDMTQSHIPTCGITQTHVSRDSRTSFVDLCEHGSAAHGPAGNTPECKRLSVYTKSYNTSYTKSYSKVH